MIRDRQMDAPGEAVTAPQPTSVSIDWYAEGESRTVLVAGVQITVRFVGRKGRRGRIVIEAPAGANFSSQNESW